MQIRNVDIHGSSVSFLISKVFDSVIERCIIIDSGIVDSSAIEFTQCYGINVSKIYLDSTLSTSISISEFSNNINISNVWMRSVIKYISFIETSGGIRDTVISNIYIDAEEITFINEQTGVQGWVTSNINLMQNPKIFNLANHSGRLRLGNRIFNGTKTSEKAISIIPGQQDESVLLVSGIIKSCRFTSFSGVGISSMVLTNGSGENIPLLFNSPPPTVNKIVTEIQYYGSDFAFNDLLSKYVKWDADTDSLAQTVIISIEYFDLQESTLIADADEISFKKDMALDRWSIQVNRIGMHAFVVFEIKNASYSQSSSSSSSQSPFFEGEFFFQSSSSSERPIGSSSSSSSSSSSAENSSSSSNEFPQAANFVNDTGAREIDIAKEFGIHYYNTGFGGSIGDSFNADFASVGAVTIAKGDSYAGTVTFFAGSKVGKYDTISIDVRNESLKLTGSVPHSTLEDSFEGVNSGLTSGLSQVQSLNVMSQEGKITNIIHKDYDLSNVYGDVAKSHIQSIKTKKSFATNFEVQTINAIDRKDSDIFSKKSFGSIVSSRKIGSVQQILSINQSTIYVIGSHAIGTLDSRLDFSFADFSFEDGEYSLSASVTENSLIVITTSRIAVFNLSLVLQYSIGYSGNMGSIISGYGDGEDFIVSTNKGIFYKSLDSIAFVKVYSPVVVGTNSADGIFRFIESSNAFIGIAKNIYWTTNNQSFGKISTESVGYVVNSLAKFYNKYVIATNKGIFITAPNMLGSGSLQAAAAAGSIIVDQSESFVDISVLQSSVGTNVIQATVYAIRSDGMLFSSEDPLYSFDKEQTPIKKPVFVKVVGDDILIFSNTHVYSINRDIMKSLTRSIQ